MEFLKKHKNLSLFFLLVLALSATYFFEERKNKINEEKENLKTALINSSDLGELNQIVGLRLNIKKREMNYYSATNSLLLSKKKVDEFFKILSGLKLKNFIPEIDVNKVGRAKYVVDDKLKLTFIFEKGEMSFTLGEKLNFDQSFYMEVEKNGKKQIAIISDESPDPGVYKTDDEYRRSEAKYRRLQMLFMLTNNVFYDGKVLKNLFSENEIGIKEVKVATFRNKSFVVDLESTKTAPPIYDGLSYFEDNWISFYRFLINLEASNVIYPYDSKKLDEVLSHFEIKDRDGKEITLTLFKKYDDRVGYFLTTSIDQSLYSLNQNDARYFFVNIQDFWKKDLNPKASEYELELNFLKGDRLIAKIIDKELFSVEIKDQKGRSVEYKRLIDFLKQEADHISELNSPVSEIKKKKVLDIKFNNRSLSVILEDNDAIFIDWGLKLRFHHYIGANLPFSIKREDYLEKKQ